MVVGVRARLDCHSIAYDSILAATCPQGYTRMHMLPVTRLNHCEA